MTPPFPFVVQQHVPLNKYSTFRIGGPALFFKELTSVQEAQQVFSFLHQTNYPFFILGKGSNCLFHDSGFQGLILYNNIQGKQFLSNTLIRVYSGNSFSLLGKNLAKQGFSGLEFACGIPGSVGGAVYMNAGTGSEDTYSVLESIEVITSQGLLHSYHITELSYGYRSTPFQQRQEFIVSATFRITKNPHALDKTTSLLQKRLQTQPYKYPSAGCIFRNPPQLSAGQLIDQAGLKGTVHGGAQISEQHGNFIINTNQASASDVCYLIQKIKQKLKKQGVMLEEEIVIVPK